MHEISTYPPVHFPGTTSVYVNYFASNALTSLINNSEGSGDYTSYGFISARAQDINKTGIGHENYSYSNVFVITPDGTRVSDFTFAGYGIEKIVRGVDPNYIIADGFFSSCYVDTTKNSPMANKFLQTGTYQIGVENFRSPNSVNLKIYAWDHPFTYDENYEPVAQKNYTFTSSDSSATSSEVVLFNVTVARDDQGKYTYSVSPVENPQPADNLPSATASPPGGFLFAAIPPTIELTPPDTTGGGGTPPSGGGGGSTNNNPSITTQPANATVTAGQAASFTVSATGNEPLTYQWQVSTNSGTTWTNIAGGTSATYTTAATTTAMNGYRYRVVVTDSTGKTVTSNSVVLQIQQAVSDITITTQPSDSHAIATESTSPDATFSVVASGGVPPLTYQWQVSTNATPTWANVTTGTGGNTATYTITPTLAMNGYRYRVLISDSTGKTVTSNAAALYVQTINGGPYTVEGVISGLTTSGLILQLGSEQLAVPANATSFRFTTTITRGAYYNVTVQQQPVNPIGCNVQNGEGTALSNVTDITVSCSIKLGITTQPANVTVTTGQTATFSVAATGSGTLTYQWQVSTDSGATWANITGATSATYTTAATTAAMNGYGYRVVVTDSTGSITSSNAILSVNAALNIAITTQPISITVATGQTATFSVTATGNGILSYQWQVSTDSGTTWVNIAGGTGPTYTTYTATAMNGYAYRVVITGSMGSVTSNAVVLNLQAGAADTYTVGGVITGLTTNGLILQINYGNQYAGGVRNIEQLAVAANATNFRFTVTKSAYYSVSVKQQPNDPLGGCVVENGNNVANSNMGNIVVNCSTFKTSPVHRRISVSARRVCAITYSGGVKCWGVGWLGDGQTTQGNFYPVDVLASSDAKGSNLSGIISIATDNRFSCALTSAGGVKCWGDNDVGQLGNGTKTGSATPVDVIGLTSGVSSIVIGAGTNKACAITTQGGVKCWGALGSGLNDPGTPSPIDANTYGLQDIADISFRSNDICVLSKIGIAACSKNGYWSSELLKNNLHDLKAIAVGSPNSCGLTFSGTVKCWDNYSGARQGEELNDIQAVSAGFNHISALTTDGLVVKTGWFPGISVPRDLVFSDRVVEISTTDELGCALMTDGGAKCWSYKSGELWGFYSTYQAYSLVDINSYQWSPAINNPSTPPPVSPGGTRYTGHYVWDPETWRYFCVPNDDVLPNIFGMRWATCPPAPF